MPAHSPTLLTLALILLPTAAHAQWTVTNLHPAGFPNSYAFACEGDIQAGYSGSPGTQSSFLWRGTPASAVNTTPAIATSSTVRAYADGYFTGIINGDTVIWDHGRSITLLSAFDQVSSRGYTYGAGGGMQVGEFGHPHQAALWRGTQDSLVWIGEGRESRAYGTDGVQQVGFSGFGVGEAALWTGTRESLVILHPPNAFNSRAVAVHQGVQVGWANFGQNLAGLWRGTAASWVSLHPPGATTSVCNGVFSGHQVGAATIGGVERASYWNGTSASWQDLSVVLPGAWGNTRAKAVWTDGISLHIVGHGRNLTTNRDEALLWTRRLRDCGTADFNGDGNLGTDQDIEAFFACLAGNCCPTCYPGGSDFNADNDHGTDQDIEAFFRVLAGGSC